jgi:hypothetical protein
MKNEVKLNDQIKRIKQLFTEERLYGNLVVNNTITEGRLSWLDNFWRSSTAIKNLSKKSKKIYEATIESVGDSLWSVAYKHIVTSKIDVINAFDNFLIKNPTIKTKYNLSKDDMGDFYEQWMGNILMSLKDGDGWQQMMKNYNLSADAFGEDNLIKFIDVFLGGSDSIKKRLRLSKVKLGKPKISEELFKLQKSGMGKRLQQVSRQVTKKIMKGGKAAYVRGNVVIPHPNGNVSAEGVNKAVEEVLKTAGISAKMLKATVGMSIKVWYVSKQLFKVLLWIGGIAGVNGIIATITKDDRDDWSFDDLFPGVLFGWIPGLPYAMEVIGDGFKGIGGYFATLTNNQIREIGEEHVQPIFEKMTISDVKGYDCKNFVDGMLKKGYDDIGLVGTLITWGTPMTEEDINKKIKSYDWTDCCNKLKKNTALMKIKNKEEQEEYNSEVDVIKPEEVVVALKQKESDDDWDIPLNLCEKFSVWYGGDDGVPWTTDNPEQVSAAAVSYCESYSDVVGCQESFLGVISKCP